jgi:hypothetical protein
MKLSVIKRSQAILSFGISNIFLKFKSPKFTIIQTGSKRRNQPLLLLALLIMPFLGFSKPLPKSSKTTKTIRRSILDVEFGTFRYVSPVTSQKSVFLG